jgi:drug/metabolite transporter (DMT)-like permease
VTLPRWLALIVGFAGILFVVRPGSVTFNIGSIFCGNSRDFIRWKTEQIT